MSSYCSGKYLRSKNFTIGRLFFLYTLEYVVSLQEIIGMKKHHQRLHRAMSMTKRPHWTTGEVLQQILGNEEPAGNNIEDPVAEEDRDEPVNGGQ